MDHNSKNNYILLRLGHPLHAINGIWHYSVSFHGVPDACREDLRLLFIYDIISLLSLFHNSLPQKRQVTRSLTIWKPSPYRNTNFQSSPIFHSPFMLLISSLRGFPGAALFHVMPHKHSKCNYSTCHKTRIHYLATSVDQQ